LKRIETTFAGRPLILETPDPQLIEKVRDIVGLYLNPPTHAVVFCVDVKPQIQALDRAAHLLPLQPGQVERRTNDYKRHGTGSLYAALDAQTGKVIGQTFPRQRAREFPRFLEQIDANVPAPLHIHLILDNASVHKSATIQRWLSRHPRFHFHFTPTYASWMNLVERRFSALTTKQLRRGAHRSVHQLVKAIEEFIAVHNETGKPYVWVKSADEILASIARFAQRTLEAHGSA
jgi:transposase